MRLQYGSYLHDTADATVTISREAVIDEARRHYAQRERWTVQGVLQAASQSALTTAINSLELAYSRDYLDLKLLDADGALTSHYLRGTNALGGVRVVQGPQYPDGKGAEYSTFRRYEIVLESEYSLAATPANLVIAWTESISFEGGGPRFVYRQPLVEFPQRQQVAVATPFRASQRGRALGLISYPVPALPLWPADEHIDQRAVTRDHPQRVGVFFRHFPITWSYSFESAAPMFGLPTRWPD